VLPGICEQIVSVYISLRAAVGRSHQYTAAPQKEGKFIFVELELYVELGD